MDLLTQLFEHNNWGNDQIIKACAKLDDSLLDKSLAPGKMTIRELLLHTVQSQAYYLWQFNGVKIPLDENPSFEAMAKSAAASGAGLLEVAKNSSSEKMTTKFEMGNYRVENWVLLVQALNHGAEHRKDIRMIMLANGVEPPRIDGWALGSSVGSLEKL